MARDLTVVLEDRPGTLADMSEALGKAGINIDGLCGFPCEDKGVIHVLVEDASAARKALEDAGIEVKGDRPVLVLDVSDRPGKLGGICRRIADAGVNIDLAYTATNTRVVLGASDLEKARSVI
ncbi:MAG: ACT domain-containing protein [Candidatus Bathyarchaeota archaeon]|nr:MAG: ACT domain-containing protein [Candidatus Bathyarchaeota archaeon]